MGKTKQKTQQAAAANSADADVPTYNVTLSSGKVFTLLPLPQHFYLLFGQLPSGMSEKAIAALGKGDAAATRELASKLTPKQVMNNMIFAREAVKYACLRPRIVLSPESDDEISAFDITEEEFAELVRYATQGGGSADLENFRR